MASFGDNSTVFQKTASLGTGLRLETGEWTAGSSSSICIPSTFNRVISVVINADGTVSVTTIAEMSASNITATTSGTTSGKVVNYVAYGW